MAFNPRTDVVLEVLNAADPSRASLAAQRLTALAGSNAPTKDFAADLDSAAISAQTPVPVEGAADARSRLAAVANGPDKVGQAKTRFEAMMLNSFVGEMLPKNASDVFGQGTAGEIWRSMLAEQVSLQVARSGALGLAKRLFATHELKPHDSAARPDGAARTATDVAQMSANPLSAPLGAELDSGSILFSGRKST